MMWICPKMWNSRIYGHVQGDSDDKSLEFLVPSWANPCPIVPRAEVALAASFSLTRWFRISTHFPEWMRNSDPQWVDHSGLSSQFFPAYSPLKIALLPQLRRYAETRFLAPPTASQSQSQPAACGGQSRSPMAGRGVPPSSRHGWPKYSIETHWWCGGPPLQETPNIGRRWKKKCKWWCGMMKLFIVEL